eukprot:scaffold245560_cov29-Prasinocladus_malaysianus.AAC.1
MIPWGHLDACQFADGTVPAAIAWPAAIIAALRVKCVFEGKLCRSPQALWNMLLREETASDYGTQVVILKHSPNGQWTA